MSSTKEARRKARAQIHLRFRPETFKRLSELAGQEQRRSVADYVRALVERTVEHEARRG